MRKIKRHHRPFLSIWTLLLVIQTIQAQPVSDHFTIESEMSKPVDVFPSQIKKYPLVNLDSMVVFGHDMKAHRVIRHIKGFLLKDILSEIDLKASNPKLLNTYYVKCVAADGYMALFSWNEIFNSVTGDHVMIITEKDGSSYEQQEDRVALISPTDKATGRRYVKGLRKIFIVQAK